METLVKKHLKDGKLNIEIKPTVFGCYSISISGEPLMEMVSAKELGWLTLRESLQLFEKSYGNIEQ